MQTFNLTRITVAVMFIATSAASFHADALPQADVENIDALKGACQQIAIDDQVPESEVDLFLLDCVNDQLTEMGYARLQELD